jgi:hypothetical protein
MRLRLSEGFAEKTMPSVARNGKRRGGAWEKTHSRAGTGMEWLFMHPGVHHHFTQPSVNQPWKR